MSPPRKKQRKAGRSNAASGDASMSSQSSASGCRAAAIRRDKPEAVFAVTTTPATIAGPSSQTSTKATNPGTRIVSKGRLQRLLNLCTELELEIYSYLESRDLLSISRVTREFRNFLLSRNSTSEKLWAQARLNTRGGLPPCPSFMSEPAFIHLLYSHFCHSCGSANVRKIIVVWFTRYCSKCIDENTVWYAAAVEELSNTDRTLGSERANVHRRVLGSTWLYHDQRGNLRLLKAQYNRVMEEFRALPEPPAAEAESALLDKLQHDRLAYYECISALETWIDERADERKAERGEAKKKRFEAILVRLRELGWEKELTFMGNRGIEAMSRLPVVRQSSKLTNSAWRKVLDAVDEVLQATRKRRIESEMRVAFRPRLAMLEEAIMTHYVTLPRTARMDCRPRAVDLALTPQCRAIFDVPASEAVTVTQFNAIMPTLAARWEEDLKARLTDYIRPHLGKIASGVDPLDLAIAVFTPKYTCTLPIACARWPSILAHRCVCGCFSRAAPTWPEDNARFGADDSYTRAIKSIDWSEQSVTAYEDGRLTSVRGHIQLPFELAHLAPPETASIVVVIMRDVVSALGLDPSEATFDELEACDAWLRCRTCEETDQDSRRLAWSWRGAFRHDYTYHRDTPHRSPVDWRRTDEDDMAEVRQVLQGSHFPRGSFSASCCWSCSLCPAFDEKLDVMVTHLRETHGITDSDQARRDGTFYPHPSTDKTQLYASSIELRGRISREDA